MGVRELTDAFLQKTLDLAFDVTRPILSDWMSYADGKLRYVFGVEFEAEWTFLVTRQFERRYIGREITPRAINAVINSIGLWWMQWHEEIPFATIVYYVINKDDFTTDVTSVITTPKPELLLSDPNWPENLAALHFGVAPETALQIAIGPNLLKAIDQYDLKSIGQAQSVGSTHSRIVWRS
jgi:hypothetical protein